MFGRPSARRAVVVVAVLLALAGCSRGSAAHTEESDSAQPTPTQPPARAPVPAAPPPPPVSPDAGPTPDFATVSKLINDAIAARELPGAVVVIGHGGRVVFHQAYGVRKAAGEPGPDGSPAPAEPMAEDTIFDMASLTKPLATATAVMQFSEQGLVGLDDPVQKYLPGFNFTNDPQRAKVTIRMLLTHFSGEPGDVELKDPWGLDGSDKQEGIRRALTTPLESAPGEGFRYSDINFMLLGLVVEAVTGMTEDTYVQQHVFAPLGMQETRYLPADKACGPRMRRGSVVVVAPALEATPCSPDSWSIDLLPRIAPTARDEEGRADPGKNPDLDYLLRGTVHDTTARRMGGVAGHAGLFSTAQDVSVFAQALLDRLAGRRSEFPLKQQTLAVMTSPQQPGHSPGQLEAANVAVREAVATSPNTANQLLVPHYPAISGQNLRGLGWDIDTRLSVPRGLVFPVGSFGHTGFTGTTVWIDPGSDTYVVLLSNSIHIRGSAPIQELRGELATATARALRLYGSG
jgi:CubicO group peptidase (beta-lactamase class C family)